MPNRAFLRAANCLTHPLTISAIVVLLLNDHILRIHWPSWLTGKLGDLTWVFFAPFICAIAVSWIVPKNRKNQEMIVGAISIGFIGVWFALAKTVPAVHDLTMDTVATINGWKGSIRLDATDLIVLPILYLSWILWQKSANTNPKPSRYLLPVLVFGIFGTLASDLPEDDVGIFCLQNDIKQMIAHGGEGGYTSYISYDNGLTWTDNKTDWSYNGYSEMQTCRKYYQLGASWNISDPQNTNITYRFNRGQSIERSVDRGQIWSLDYDLSELNKDIRNVYHYGQFKQTSGDISIFLGPLDAKFDQNTGNLVVAMGWDGILVRTPDSKWHWVTVGPYHIENLNQPQAIFPLLASNEIWLAFLLIPLSIATLLYSIQRVTLGLIGAIALGWAFWFVSVIWPPMIRPSTSIWGIGFFGIILFPLTGLYAIPFALYALKHIRGNQATLILVFISIITPFLFLLPFVLWTQGTIGNYRMATLFAIALAAGSLVVGRNLLIDLSDLEIIPFQRRKLDE